MSEFGRALGIIKQLAALEEANRTAAKAAGDKVPTKTVHTVGRLRWQFTSDGQHRLLRPNKLTADTIPSSKKQSKNFWSMVESNF